jgi:type 1 glutamine amidotransferase
MVKRLLICALFALLFGLMTGFTFASPPIRILVVTGGHDYNKEEFNAMLSALAPSVTYRIAEFPAAFDEFRSGNRDKYDVLVFYHMWQEITSEQEKMVEECVRGGKPLVALHHSICAFDNWPGYWNIIGGKYFHNPVVFKGKQYPACSYIHDLHFLVTIAGDHPVTKGVGNFEIFDETYKGYYVADDVTPLLTTSEPSSQPVIGWAKNYGKARIVVLQSGHDTPTFRNPSFRKLLLQAIEWVNSK